MRSMLAALLSLLLCAERASAQPAQLLGPDLEPRDVLVQSFASDSAEVIDAQGDTQRLSSDQVLRLTFDTPPRAWASPDNMVATLRDGQVLVGRVLGPGEDGESLRLALAAGGREVALSLDDLVSLATQRGLHVPAAEGDDALLLATGETMTGFVESFGDGVVGFVIGDADDAVDLPMDRVHAIAIANKPRPAQPEPGLVRVLLADDSVLLLRGATIEQLSGTAERALVGASLLPMDDPALTLPLASVRQIDRVSGGAALTRLADDAMSVLSGGEVFGVAMPPRIEADGSIRLHAPTTLGFALPRGALRLTLTARLELGQDIPRNRRALAGCELVVYAGDEVIGRCTLLPDEPAQRINAVLNGGDLRIELKPGINGPVLDRVRISHAEVLVGG